MRGISGLVWVLGLGLPLSAKEPARPVDGAREVVAAITREARRNAAAPRPAAGDDLTVLYVRSAAAAARRLPPEQAPGAMLLALGVALDDSDLLRRNPLTAGLCKQIETDDERQKRLAVLGTPTVRGRRDLCQHFVVSALLTEAGSAVLAEAAGLLKEQRDMRKGGSGFSFADLQADLAGVAFAVRLKKGELSPEKLAKGFVVADFVPDHAGLKEGLSEERFKELFGSTTDDRFRAEVDKLRRRIEAAGKKD